MNLCPTILSSFHDPDTLLEQAFSEEFLRERGYDRCRVSHLPTALAKSLMAEACIYASDKLAEIEARAGLVQEVHGLVPAG